MSNKKLLIYFSTILATLIPCPGHFGFGIILAVVFDIIFILSILAKHLFIKIKIDEYSKILQPVMICSLVTFFYIMLVFFSPVLAMQLSFILYIQAFSIYLQLFMFEPDTEVSLKDDFSSQLYKCVLFTSVTLAFTLVRDVLGYGCISFPIHAGLYSISLFNIKSLTFMNFFASIPGASIICAVIISAVLYFNNLKQSRLSGDSDE